MAGPVSAPADPGVTRLAIVAELRLPSFTLSVDIDTEARVLALTGSSGAGKSTLLHMVAGLVRPDRGRISVGDTVFLDTDRGLVRPVHRRGIGYVFQDGRLFPHLTVAQNLRYGRWFAGSRPAPIGEPELVALLGIEPLLGRRTGHLSGGERQRVALGRALLAGPRLLLMDEPLAAVDEARRQDLLSLIEQIRDRTDVPIFYVSHNQAEISRLADAVLTVAGGQARL